MAIDRLKAWQQLHVLLLNPSQCDPLPTTTILSCPNCLQNANSFVRTLLKELLYFALLYSQFLDYDLSVWCCKHLVLAGQSFVVDSISITILAKRAAGFRG